MHTSTLNRAGLLITKAILLGLLMALAVACSHAQVVSPVVIECGHKCRGEFTISNPSVQAFSAVVQPFSFSLDAKTGKSILRPLDSTVDVHLDEMAARIGPRSEHTFAYSIRCSQFPCLVTMYAAMTVGHTEQGLAVRVMLPHVAYVCDTAKHCRADARRAAGLTD
jgi:hypothetical protein